MDTLICKNRKKRVIAASICKERQGLQGNPLLIIAALLYIPHPPQSTVFSFSIVKVTEPQRQGYQHRPYKGETSEN